MNFLESIRFENRDYQLLRLHQHRVNTTFATHFPNQKPLALIDVLPRFEKGGKYKFRVVYDHETFVIEHSVYRPKEIKCVKMMEANALDYSYKYADRNQLNQLHAQSGADEIIIVKDGLITDASYANIACFDGLKWWTPQQPLLKGIRRQDLLNRGVLFERRIAPDDLSTFSKVCLINAMLDLDEMRIAQDQIIDADERR